MAIRWPIARKRVVRIYPGLAILLWGFVSGCGNSDGRISLDRNQTAQLSKMLATYEGSAQPRRIMGATMTGVWTLTFLQDESGSLKCKTSLRLHDSENGWGSPTKATADVKLYKGSSDGHFHLRVEGAFSENEPNWTAYIDDVSLSSDHAVDKITLFDMDSYEITLSKK